MNKKKVVAIIPARGGSKGLPRKNIRMLAGKPLVAYAIEVAKKCPYINRVLVSTDDKEIADVSKKWGADVPFLRPAEFSDDFTTTVQVLNHALDWLKEHEQYEPDIVVFLQPTDVFRTQGMVDEVVHKMLKDSTFDTVFSAYREMKNYWHYVDGKLVRLDNRPQVARQIKEPIFREDTGLICATRPYVIRSGRRIGDKVDIVVSTDQATSIDIHESYDFFLAEKTLTEWGKVVNS